MSITSEKVFIQKIKEGYRLEKLIQFKRCLYYLTNKKNELTVSISLIKKLWSKGVIDDNWDVHLSEK